MLSQRRPGGAWHPACCYPRQQMQWSEAPIGSRRLNTVGPRGMGKIPRQESGGRNAQPLASSATTATKTTNKDHHFETMCRGKHGAKPAKSSKHEDAISDTLCPITSTDLDSTKIASVDHHVFDKFTKAWLRRRSKSQPYVRLQVNIQREDYDHYGFPFRVPQVRSFVS